MKKEKQNATWKRKRQCKVDTVFAGDSAVDISQREQCVLGSFFFSPEANKQRWQRTELL